MDDIREHLSIECEALLAALDLYGAHKALCQQGLDRAAIAHETALCTCGLSVALNDPIRWAEERKDRGRG